MALRNSEPATLRTGSQLGQYAQRIHAVGPAHFGIVTIDCAKHRSILRMRSALGQELLPPSVFTHTHSALKQVLDNVIRVRSQHDLRDIVVAVEQTGHFHQPIVRAFRGAAYDTRIIHPRVSQRFRRALHQGQKTDPHDLDGLYLAVCQGLGLALRESPDVYQGLLILTRHRRDLVRRQSKLQTQLRDVAHRYLPGLLDLARLPWNQTPLMTLVRDYLSPRQILDQGFDTLRHNFLKINARIPTKWAERILTWAEQALDGCPLAELWRRRFCDLDDQRKQVHDQIFAVEREEASLLAQTPYLLLLAIPGINVVSAAEYAGEAGPADHYTHPNQITGRAGLVPSRYQSDRVDLRHGPLVKQANRSLRYSLVQIANNLLMHNHHYHARGLIWKRQRKSHGWICVKVAKSFSRLSYGIVMSGEIRQHPSLRDPQAILDKLVAFHRQHGTAGHQIRCDLQAAVEQIPSSRRTAEAAPLQEKLRKLQAAQRGPQSLASILTLVLTRLSVVSSETGESTPCQP